VELVVVDENGVRVSREITYNAIISLHEKEGLEIEIASPKAGM